MNLCQFHLRIMACGTTALDHTWGTREHCDPYWRLYVNKHRGAYLTLGSERYDIVPNRVHLIPAWVHLRCHCQGSCEHLYVHFHVIGLSSPVLRTVVPRPVGLAERVDYDTIAQSLWRRGKSELHEALHTAMSAQALVSRTLDELCANLPTEKLCRLTSAQLDEGRIAPVLHYIESHLERRLDNAVLARIAHQSKGRFIREFGRVVGQTPAHYVMERRTAAAAERLAFTGESIDSIATAVGFANRFYFSRIFQRLMGTSPAKYRRLGLAAERDAGGT
jgi:AraC-like DNA-binding protein